MEKELIKLAKNGDKKKKEELYNKYINMIASTTNKAFNICENLDKEDIFQELSVVFLKAIDNFDLTKDNKFSTYLYICLNKRIPYIINKSKYCGNKIKSKEENLYLQISRLLKKNKEKKEILNILKISSNEYDFVLSLCNNNNSLDDESIKKNLPFYYDNSAIENVYIEKLLSKLNKIERQVIYSTYVLDKTKTQTAKDMNYSQQYINKVEKNALKKLREIIDNNIKI